jgi:hypothetical protein
MPIVSKDERLVVENEPNFPVRYREKGWIDLKELCVGARLMRHRYE